MTKAKERSPDLLVEKFKDLLPSAKKYHDAALDEFENSFSRDTCGYVFVWDCERLWKLAEGLSAKDMSMEEVTKPIKKRLDAIANSATERKRAKAANLKYPPILDVDGRVMDGCHRLYMMECLGRDTVRVKQFKITPTPDRIYKR